MSTKPPAKSPAKTRPAPDPVQTLEQPAPIDRFDLSLDEFCALRSRSAQAEMISAYHASERRAGRAKDSEAGFESRFNAFINRPA